LEIQGLDDNNGRYGFLIESPEPIDWVNNGQGRVSLMVEHSPSAMTGAEPAFGAVKLINCSLQNPEWVEILVQEALDLSGYEIKRQRELDDGSIELWDYHEFAPGSQMSAGSVIRVHRGDELPASTDPERVDIYKGSGVNLLRNGGEVLVLLDPSGREVHRRHFMPDGEFTTSYDVVIAPDQDGTRSFIFLRDGGTFVDQVPDGSFRLSWTFHRRDAGEDRPILRRRGSTNPEQATIEFNVPARPS
jgi:hypothetical protein